MDERMDELERLYREIGPLVWAYLRRRTGDPEVADELLQETFLTLARDRSGLDGARSQRAWLIGVARNVLRRHARRWAYRRTTGLPDEHPAAEARQEDPRLEEMRRAIARLPTAQREALELRLTEEMPYAEIAEALAIPVGTVRSRLHLAVVALKNDLQAAVQRSTPSVRRRR